MSDDEYRPQPYPAWRYHKSGEARLVHTPAEAMALGDGWADSPARFLEPAPAAPAPVSDAPADLPPAEEPEPEPVRLRVREPIAKLARSQPPAKPPHAGARKKR